jgi:hypothetical protein
VFISRRKSFRIKIEDVLIVLQISHPLVPCLSKTYS